MIRIPSCYESFWVDELHSAWCVWGSLSDVAPRASIGNQSPVWFWALWFWKQVVGESEIVLRMISVLAIASSAMSLCYVLARKCHPIVGVTAGLVLAIETNSIFFGTELRPYSAIVLLGTWACCSLMMCDRAVVPVAGLTIAALWIQPTSFAVMIGLLGIAAMSLRCDGKRLRRTDFLWLAFVIVNVMLVASMVLFPSWQTRSRWSAFAVAPDFLSAVKLWSWLWLWFIPIVMIALSRRRQLRVLSALALWCVIVALSFWVASRMDWVHLWHRRYMIALLPVFATLVGHSVLLAKDWSRWRWGVASVMIIGLLVSQGTLGTMAKHPSRLAYRGEDWRGAMAHLRTKRVKVVEIDAGLIEAQGYLNDAGELEIDKLSELMREYLVCVAHGPYPTGDAISIPATVPNLRKGSFVKRGRIRAGKIQEAKNMLHFGTVTVRER